jgi:site-specific recombinase XerD
VRGKGSKVRLLPLAPEAIQLLDHYLRLERPPRGGAAISRDPALLLLVTTKT